MDLGLRGKVAFVGASSQGLGKNVAMEFAREGADLVICSRNESNVKAAEAEIAANGAGEVLAVTGDLSKAEDRRSIINRALDKFGSIDILVTNTGGPPAGVFEDFGQDAWDSAYELLLGSAVELIRGFLPGMKKKMSGRMIFITSQAVKQPVENLILSNSVRSSLVGLMKSLAMELGPYNITVNNVMPGYTETARLQRLLETSPGLSAARDEISLGRFGKPEELAAAVAFLASERASYITGVSLAVDGGWIKGV